MRKKKENSLKSELKSIKSKDKENIKIAILVGPEGGIDLEEIEELSKAGAVIVTLGKKNFKNRNCGFKCIKQYNV